MSRKKNSSKNFYPKALKSAFRKGEACMYSLKWVILISSILTCIDKSIQISTYLNLGVSVIWGIVSGSFIGLIFAWILIQAVMEMNSYVPLIFFFCASFCLWLAYSQNHWYVVIVVFMYSLHAISNDLKIQINKAFQV